MSGRELSWLCVEQTVQHNHASMAIISVGTVIAITAAKDLCCQGPRSPMTIVIMDLWIQRQGRSSTGKGCLLKVIEKHRIEIDPLRHSRRCMWLTHTHTHTVHITHALKKKKKKKKLRRKLVFVGDTLLQPCRLKSRSRIRKFADWRSRSASIENCKGHYNDITLFRGGKPEMSNRSAATSSRKWSRMLDTGKSQHSDGEIIEDSYLMDDLIGRCRLFWQVWWEKI